MNNALNGIWRMGDRDECSVKHIGHATAALAMGRDWTDGLDYDKPWGRDEDWMPLETYYRLHPDGLDDVEIFGDWAMIPWDEKRKQMENAQLGKRWAKVQAKRDAWGVDRFHEVMQATKFDLYHLSILKFDWGYDEAKHDEAH